VVDGVAPSPPNRWPGHFARQYLERCWNIALLRSEVIGFAAVCGLSCASMLAAMLALMLYRRSEHRM
jgi:hypothetical protein